MQSNDQPTSNEPQQHRKQTTKTKKPGKFLVNGDVFVKLLKVCENKMTTNSATSKCELLGALC